MNRPLGAFGFLLGLLALAMFAVSSTSRSTAVRLLPPVKRFAPSSQATRGAKLQPFVATATVEAGEGPAPYYLIGDDLCDPDSVEWSEWQPAKTPLVNLRGGQRTQMTSVCVQQAEKTELAERGPLTIDCRSHYDRVYDKAVYGVADVDLFERQASVAAVAESRQISDVEVTAIFRGLFESPRNNTIAPASDKKNDKQKLTGGDSWKAELRGFAGGLGNWLGYWAAAYMDSLSEERQVKAKTTDSLSWSEYSDLIDRGSAPPAAKLAAAGTSGGSGSVRSSGWLRHSAAATLYHLGLILEAAGAEMDRGSGR